MYHSIPYLVAAYVIIFGAIIGYHMWMKKAENQIDERLAELKEAGDS